MTLIHRSLPLRVPTVPALPAPGRRSLARAAVLALGLGLNCGSVTAWGQAVGTLDPALVSETGNWNDAQAQQVSGYLRGHVQSLLSGEESAIEGSREAILAPLRTAGATEPFIRQFARAISREIAPATQSDSLQVRVNAMILAGRLPDPSALDPVAVGLQDEDAGVRYLAAVALNGLIARDLVVDNQRGPVLQLVDSQLEKEESTFAAAPMFKAMLDLGAIAPLLQSLNGRVGRHVGRPNADFGPEADALRGIYTRLFSGEGTAAEVKQLGRAAARYQRLAAQQLEAGNVSDTDSHIEIIRVGQTALTFVRERLNSTESIPPSVVAPITQERWADVVEISNRWSTLLQAQPVGLAPGDLEINAAAPASEPAPAAG